MADDFDRKARRRISVRVPTANLGMIDRAAALQGFSRDAFVLDAALRAAEEVLSEQNLIHMSSEGFAEFVGILSQPGKVIPRLEDLLRRPAPWKEEQAGLR